MKNNYYFSRESIQSGFNHAFLSLMIAMIFLGIPGVTVAQDPGESFITDLGETTICEGGTTTIQVIICAGESPWTVVYSDGTNNYTINNYESNCDPETPDYGGDPISVTPSVTTTYHLVSVHDANGYSMPIYNGTVTITVNPLPSNVVVSTDPTIICPGVDFAISATA
ncbi:MAG TPA: hypothetical protein P5104_07480, partial [Bacteroidales bacterium]|nr:hypothetical protein [Bacteroidales bacterium]